MSDRDFYEVLGVDKGADEAKIKKAYKRLAMKYHPDRNADDKAGAEKKFKEVRKAYDVISNPQKRSAYDQFGHAGVEQGGQGFGGGNPFGNAGGFGDIFGDIFGGGNSKPDNRGSDLRYDLEIDLKQAADGDTVKIRVQKMILVTHALEAAQNLELLLKLVEIVVEQVKRQCNKVFSLSSVLAINVMGLVRKLNLLVEPVVVRALLGIKKLCL